MNNSDSSECGHGGSHGRFGDGVHGRSNEGSRKRDVAAETGGEVDGIGGEVDVVREEDKVIVGVREAAVEKLLRGVTVFDGRRSEIHDVLRRE